MTALVSVLALVLHIVAMASGAMAPPASGGGDAEVHAHHVTSVPDHDAGSPADGLEHKPPCCILSLCPGLPGPPVSHVEAYQPQQSAGVLVFEADAATAAPRILLLRPVGARAPPMRA